MKFSKSIIFLGLLSTILFTGCHKKPEPRPVAMNEYVPTSGDEVSSGVTVEVTEDMIKRLKDRAK